MSSNRISIAKSLAALAVASVVTSSTVAASGHLKVIDIGLERGEGHAPHRAPVVNDRGQVAYRDPYRFVRGDDAAVVKIAAYGDPVPDGISILTAAHNAWPAIDDSGRIAFRHGFANVGVGAHIGIFYGDETDVVEIARSRRLGSTGPNQVPLEFNDASQPALNERGQVAFYGNTNNGWRILRGDGTTLTSIYPAGQQTPTGDSVFSSLDLGTSGYDQQPALNNAGQVAFTTRLTDNAGTLAGSGIFLGDGTTTVQIARTGQVLSDLNGQINSLASRPVVNDAGQVAFSAAVDGAAGRRGMVLRGDGATLTKIAQQGDKLPHGNEELFAVGGPYVPINNSGSMAFLGVIGQSGSVSGTTRVIFRGDGTNLTEIVRHGQLAPDGNGVFDWNLGPPSLNDAGQIAFTANLTGTTGGGSDNFGIYFHDDSLGLLQVARTGDPLLGSTIRRLLFRGSGIDLGGGLNQSGPARLAYYFELTDGRRGVALWSLVPEPNGIVLVATAGVVYGLFTRRRRVSA